MQFSACPGSSSGYRDDFQSPRNRQNGRDWSWNSPKSYYTRSKYNYNGPNFRGYPHRYGYGDYRPRPNPSFRNDNSMNNGRGRPGWRKPSNYSFNNKRSYQDDSVRWRSSQPPRRVSPLRARENESPRQPGFRSRSELPPPHSDAKRARLDPPAAERDSSGKENTARRVSLTAGADAGRFYGSRPMRSPSQSPQRRRPADGGTPARPSASPRKTGEAGKALQLYGGQAQAPVLELVPVNAPDQHKHLSDPLYIGLPNFGNSCYQNATLQSLLGLRPFLSEMVALGPALDADRCRTLRAVARLMELRQSARGTSVSSHLNDLRDVFARIDPAFRGTEMQDANEFLLRLLDTIKEEVDGSRPPTPELPAPPADLPGTATNPVRDNFEYQTVESYMCTKCQESVLKRQENISWFVSVPRRQGSGAAPTLQDALRLSMRPDRRELHCEKCQHDECSVTTQISKLPRTLIVQLNRYVFVGEESKKIRANVEIPKFVSLREYAAEDAVRPPTWDAARYGSSSPEEAKRKEPAASAAEPERPAAPRPFGPAPAPAAVADLVELVELDGAEERPPRPAEDEDSQLQEAIRRSLEEGEPADLAAEQARLSQFCVEDDGSAAAGQAVDPAGAHSYRLVGLVSHYGGATQAGHYVADVYSLGRRRWFHYDDRSVTCVSEQDVLGDGHQRNGYIFFYLHTDLCSQVAKVDSSAT